MPLLLCPCLAAARIAALSASLVVAGGASPDAGAVSGVVVSADATARPIRRAIVTLSGGSIGSRSVVTDDDGAFGFGDLPAGRYTLVAKKAAHPSATFGATRPGRPGTSLVVGRDERIHVTLRMARGAVVSGTIADPMGTPLAGVSVSAIDVRSVGNPSAPSPEVVTTDDRGVYRIFGLVPGDYVIAATPRSIGSGATLVRSSDEVDAVLAALARRDGRASGKSAAETGASLSRPRSVGFAPTYYPGAALFSEAGRLSLVAGEERTAVDVVAAPVPIAEVSGTISGAASPTAVQLSLLADGPRFPSALGASPVLSSRPDRDGRFTFGNMAPGRYRIVARGPRTPGDFLYAAVDVDVIGHDVSGVVLSLGPGSTLSGRLVIEGEEATRRVDLSTARVTLAPPGGTWSSNTNGTLLGNAFNAVVPVPVQANGTFAIGGIAPGTYRLQCTLPSGLGGEWRLRSAVAGARDLLEGSIEVAAGVDLVGATLTISNTHTELSGTVAGAGAVPQLVVAFPADRSRWRAGSRRMASSRPANDGRYQLLDLPAGDYLVAVAEDLDDEEWQRPEMLAALSASAVTVTIVDGRPAVVDLTAR